MIYRWILALMILSVFIASTPAQSSSVAIAGMQGDSVVLYGENGNTARVLARNGRPLVAVPSGGFLYADTDRDALYFYDGQVSRLVSDTYLDMCGADITPDGAFAVFAAFSFYDVDGTPDDRPPDEVLTVVRQSLLDLTRPYEVLGQMRIVAAGGGGGGPFYAMDLVFWDDRGVYPGNEVNIDYTPYGILHGTRCRYGNAYLSDLTTSVTSVLDIYNYTLSPDRTRVFGVFNRTEPGQADFRMYDLATGDYRVFATPLEDYPGINQFGVHMMWGDDGMIYYTTMSRQNENYGLTGEQAADFFYDIPQETRTVSIYRIDPNTEAVTQVFSQDQAWLIGRMKMLNGVLYFSVIPDASALVDAWRRGDYTINDVDSFEAGKAYVLPDVYQRTPDGTVLLVQRDVLRALPVIIPNR